METNQKEGAIEKAHTEMLKSLNRFGRIQVCHPENGGNRPARFSQTCRIVPDKSRRK
jgi:hypothetical protein